MKLELLTSALFTLPDKYSAQSAYDIFQLYLGVNFVFLV